MIATDDPRHRTNPGYVAGCREFCCREAHRLDALARRRTPSPLVDATGTHRRIQGLQHLGWSLAKISEAAGRSELWAQKLMDQGRVNQSTASLIARVYDDLSMTPCPHRCAARVAAAARSKGWPPPLAWDDDEIDDPTAAPYQPHTRVDVDDVVVQRVLTGEWRLPTTKAEKYVVVDRWRAQGRSSNELERLTGWNVQRYLPTREEVA